MARQQVLHLAARFVLGRCPPSCHHASSALAAHLKAGTALIPAAAQHQWSRLNNILPALARAFATLPDHQVIQMPALSPTMTQGNIAAWRKSEGDQIAPGDILAEVETDKATIEWEAQEEGYLAKILYPAGSKDVKVGEGVAILVEEQSDASAFKDYSPSDESSAPASSAAEPPPAADESKPAASSSSAPSGSDFPSHTIMEMPALSPTMSQGNIIAWQKKVGDEVAPGDLLCEVETDKATIAWEAQEEGYIAAILLEDGSKDVPVGAPAAVIVEDKDSVPAFANFTAADAEGAAKPKEPTSGPPPQKPADDEPAPKPASKPAPAAAASKPAPAAPSGGRIVASPYAKKLAAEAGVSLEGVAGTGPGGRIVGEDVHKLIETKGTGAAAGPSKSAAPGGGAPSAEPAPGGEWTDASVSQIKRVTAARLLESKLTIPHYYLTSELRVDSLLQLRAHVNASLEASGSGKLSVNDFIVKAAALALKKVPAMNSSWQGDFIREYHNIDVNVAVQTPVGLMVPFVRNADQKGLLAISSEVKKLAAKAKEGKLQPAEFMGGTFSISNLGMFGIKQFAAIVNPPQAGILAVGATDKKVIMNKSGEYEEASVMIVTLSCDHRVVDGAVGAQWLQAFKAFVEEPLTLMVS